jgi:hypothetical protein
MALCSDCRHRDGVTCLHRDLKANGGAGLNITFPRPTGMHIDYRDKAGRRRGEWHNVYNGPPSKCAGREVDTLKLPEAQP